jgi:hypothetical protein
MNSAYLEVTYRRGKAVAAYYYLPRFPGQRSVRTRRVEPGFLIDFAKSGRPIGVEITAPSALSVTAFNRVLRELGIPPIKRRRRSPLLASCEFFGNGAADWPA